MLAMQYSVRLPIDFDTAQVRDRVARRQPLFDRLPGLAGKFYLYNEAERIYAPLYLWADHEAAERFVLEDLFQDVVATFGRPRVRRWTVLGLDFGDRSLKPGVACIETDKIERNLPLSDLKAREAAAHEQALGQDGLYVRLVGLDSDRWELSRFSLWQDRAGPSKSRADCLQRFDVLGCGVAEPAYR